MTNIKMIELTVLFYTEPPLSAHTSLKFPFKSSCPLVNSWELVLGDEFTFSPSCQAPDKATFLFNQHLPLKYWLSSRQQLHLSLIP